jgi:hypothetical protein
MCEEATPYDTVNELNDNQYHVYSVKGVEGNNSFN